MIRRTRKDQGVVAVSVVISTRHTVGCVCGAGANGCLKYENRGRNREYDLEHTRQPKWLARAHDVAALAIKGGSAYLNFPESFHTLPVRLPRTSNPSGHFASSCRDKHESSSSPSINDHDSLFDLPDLMTHAMDQSDGFWFYSSSAWKTCEVDSGFRFEEPFSRDDHY
ncbi:hypothetical protein F3Y22_tig00004013pilonHSYRG00175 [Hibiscus syriacus]|uniref:AP2/ERF domain-containing protein n=1 Tax=Hibiscus syriacus TaxID=106335 RepID=A0A6A3CPG8_HIBSY|nr:hypothetical protein F3Y22_tig00004013pilonHSYRG00175 [Hibiscus syriacus]